MLSAEDINTEIRTGTSSSAFLNKLWKIVNDPQSDHLIKWSQQGTSFIILDEIKFSQEILPKYFKHNNMASFIRQLHMYRFKKVASVDSGALCIDKGEIEFHHPYFQREKHFLIENIKRKPQGQSNRMPETSTTVTFTERSNNLSTVISEIRKLREDHEALKSELIAVKGENDVLWRDHNAFKLKFSKQQQIIEKLVNFLVAMVKSPGQTLQPKRKYNYLALEGGTSSTSDSADENYNVQSIPLQYEPSNLLALTGPVIQEVTHMEEDSSPSFFDKVFKPSFSANIQTSQPAKTSNESNASNSQMTVGNSNSNRLNLLQTIKLNPGKNWDDMLIESNGEKSDVSKAPNNQSQVPCAVQSPNEGMFPVDEEYWNPELFTTVNPSVVNPNIVVNCSKPSLETLSKNESFEGQKGNTVTKFSTSSTPGKCMSFTPISSSKETVSGAVESKNRRERSTKIHSKGHKASKSHLNSAPQIFDHNRRTTSDDTSDDINAPFPDSLDRVNFGKQMNSKRGKNLSLLALSHGDGGPSGKMESTIKEVRPMKTNPQELSTSLPSHHNQILELAASKTGANAPSQEINYNNKNELINRLDEVQNSIESLQSILSNNPSLSVDASTIISLFENDDRDQYLPNNEEVVGNEVSIYNPSWSDLDDVVDNPSDSFNFASLIEEENEELTASPKKPRLNLDVKSEVPDGNSDDDMLLTPKPHFGSSKYI